ncbi:MAG: 2-amino-4-hydroxy-6-hydroxymethyldihydropteridine diphosphokinase [Rhodobacteraceae bacterium]|nr:2-amino-4-hydroxy-6-hydroxymethyldihydropteridine diphosphokinase [Paracoccaceae bacterium]
MTDRICVKNLCLHGYHGVMPEETRLGQKFYVDLDCVVDLEPCTEIDDYSRTICYASLCDLAEEVSRNGPYQLIETLGDRIARAVLERFPPVREVQVHVRKPSAPIAANLDHVGVSIVRKRLYRVGFSLGSNMGEKAANLRRALAYLDTLEGLDIERVSQFYKTAPWGKEDQDWFLNACATGWTTLQPQSILKSIKRIELEIGRVPGERWGPRLIDIDLLFVDDLQIETARLTLPHAELFNRAFVLIPLAEIAGDVTLSGRNISEAAKSLGREGGDAIPQ